MSDIFFTIEREGKGLFKEKMSKFLSFALHVETVEEAKNAVKRFQNEYHDSRHVCWAYMLGPERKEWQLNDNGEPSGTAGKPILGQINSAGITDVAVIVVRYFGGIKLGTPGLIAAYREAARLAIEDAGRKEMHVMKRFSFTFPYISMNSVMKLMKTYSPEIKKQIFDNSCEMTISIRENMAEALGRELGDIDGLTFIEDN